MKKLFVCVSLMVGFLSVNAFAQEVGEEITEEELMRFATMEDSVMVFFEQKNDELMDMIRNHEDIGGAARYNEIRAAWGDSDKLDEIEITEEEKKAYGDIQEYMGTLSDEVREFKIELIKNEEVLGISTFNKVNNAMKENPEIKEKVDSLQAELKEQRASDDGV